MQAPLLDKCIPTVLHFGKNISLGLGSFMQVVSCLWILPRGIFWHVDLFEELPNKEDYWIVQFLGFMNEIQLHHTYRNVQNFVFMYICESYDVRAHTFIIFPKGSVISTRVGTIVLMCKLVEKEVILWLELLLGFLQDFNVSCGRCYIWKYFEINPYFAYTRVSQ